MRSLLVNSFCTFRALKGAVVTFLAILILSSNVQARPSAGEERGRITIEVDKSSQRMTVYVDGEKRHVFKVSTGKAGFATPSGTFRVLNMKPMHYSQKYDNAPMPNSMFFTNVGHAIHATNAVKNLGHVASHGCIRLAPRDAKMLYDLVASTGMRSVKIHIS